METDEAGLGWRWMRQGWGWRQAMQMLLQSRGTEQAAEGAEKP